MDPNEHEFAKALLDVLPPHPGVQLVAPCTSRSMPSTIPAWVDIEGIEMPLAVGQSIPYDINYLRPLFPRSA